jgi:hypothetical protein
MAKDLVVGICLFAPGLSFLMPEAAAGCHGLTKGQTGKSSRITIAFHLAPSLFVAAQKVSETISRRVAGFSITLCFVAATFLMPLDGRPRFRRLLSVNDDALPSKPMKFGHLILDTSYFCDTAKAHRLIPGQVKLATKSEGVRRETLLTFFRATKRRIRVQQLRRGLAA